MKGILQWIHSRVSLIQVAVVDRYHRLSTVVKQIFQEPVVKRGLDGFTNLADIEIIVGIKRSERAKAIYKDSLKANGILLSYILCYETVIKPMMYQYVIHKDSYADEIMEKAAFCMFMRLSAGLIIDNLLRSLSLATVFGEEPCELHFSALKHCQHCSSMAMTRAKIASPIYYISNSIVLSMISLLPYGDYINWIARPIVYGGQGLLEGNLNLCTDHRYQVMSRYNSYYFAQGASLIINAKLISCAIQSVTGAKSHYIDDICFAVLFQYYIAVAYLAKKPELAKEPGIDFFYMNRLMVEKIGKKIPDIVKYFKGSEVSSGDGFKHIRYFLNHPATDYLKSIVLPKDLSSLYHFIKRPVVQQWFELHSPMIKTVVKELVKIRHDWRLRSVGYVKEYLPGRILSPEDSMVVSILLAKQTEFAIKTIDSIIALAELKTAIYNINDFEQALNTIREDDKLPLPVVPLPQPDIQTAIQPVNLPKTLVPVPVPVAAVSPLLNGVNTSPSFEDWHQISTEVKSDAARVHKQLEEEWNMMPTRLKNNSLFKNNNSQDVLSDDEDWVEIKASKPPAKQLQSKTKWGFH